MVSIKAVIPKTIDSDHYNSNFYLFMLGIGSGIKPSLKSLMLRTHIDTETDHL